MAESNEQPNAENFKELTSKTPSKKAVKKANPKKAARKKAPQAKGRVPSSNSNYPRHSILKALRIPKAILEQNAGKECTDVESATFVGVSYNSGPYASEISSAIKFSLLERTEPKKIKPTEIAKRILRPQTADDELNGYREAVLSAPVISNVYKHYRGENLPDRKFFENALNETFKIPEEKFSEFIDIFTESLTVAKLI